jgi:hypothetical protein
MDWPSSNVHVTGANEAISYGHPWAGGNAYRMFGANVPASTAWPAANRVLLWPFRIPEVKTFYQLVAGFGSTAGGNWDAGIYDWSGNRLVNAGSTARTATSEVVANITDTTLLPGRYWAALQLDGTNTVQAVTPANIGITKAMGLRQASPGSFGLPTTVTFETVASAVFPIALGLWMRA